jgi:hypothetical protein
VDTAFAEGTENPGLNPASTYKVPISIAMLLSNIDLICIVCVLKRRIKALAEIKKKNN